MASLLGTVWFVCLVGVVCFCLGVSFSDRVKNFVGR